MKTNVKAFTIIELLVVLVVSAILITLIVISLQNFTKNYYSNRSLVNTAINDFYEMSRKREQYLDKEFAKEIFMHDDFIEEDSLVHNFYLNHSIAIDSSRNDSVDMGYIKILSFDLNNLLPVNQMNTIYQ